MKINISEFKDKVHACWIGKNIGGTIGGPYEGAKEMLDIKGFSTPANVVLPNDDLDLQLIWMEAVKRVGPKNINATVLGEFWISYVTPYWNEYGRCKNNMIMGLIPPLSGEAFNEWKHSNGAWIRTEIWACLAPGQPDIALRYAYEDASVDHGMGEGTVAAIFTAALQSAAFVETDLRKLIEIGLSKISEESRTAKSVKCVIDCFDKGMDYVETRNKVFDMNSDLGNGWFEAPSNIAYAVLGLLWGAGDFKKSMIYAVNCGDDTDCTAGLVGSVLGIIGGTKAIPQDWIDHIGDEIVTVAIADGVLSARASTCSQLTDDIVKYAPIMLCENNANVEITECETEIDDNAYEKMYGINKENEIYYPQLPYSCRIDFNYASAIVMYDGEPSIAPNETKKIKIRFVNNIPVYGNKQYYLKFRFLPTDGFEVKGPKSMFLSRWSPFDLDFYHDKPYCEAEFEITAPDSVEAKNTVVIEAIAEGRVTPAYIPINFVGV